jgi:hypothetical protein
MEEIWLSNLAPAGANARGRNAAFPSSRPVLADRCRSLQAIRRFCNSGGLTLFISSSRRRTGLTVWKRARPRCRRRRRSPTRNRRRWRRRRRRSRSRSSRRRRCSGGCDRWCLRRQRLARSGRLRVPRWHRGPARFWQRLSAFGFWQRRLWCGPRSSRWYRLRLTRDGWLAVYRWQRLSA